MASQCPAELKAFLPYCKISQEFSKRDPVISYYCQLYVVQNGLRQSTKNVEVKKFLMNMMDAMEIIKSSGNEALTNEVAGQAHVENVAFKLFLHADTEDRASKFSKNVVKAFYTASHIFETLTLFGELSEEIQRNKKYAKWKAAYISKCLKTGETPIPGPVGQDDEGLFDFGDIPEMRSQSDNSSNDNSNIAPTPPAPGFNTGYNMAPHYNPSYNDANTSVQQQPPTNNFNLPTPSNYNYNKNDNATPVAPTGATANIISTTTTSSSSGVTISPQVSDKAQKCCRFAISALQYDDTSTAIENLQKALRLLQTGKL